ncbi:bifunctional fucokinase/fucose-1-phosphate guanylyltransferase [Fimbriimonas ginsengisoli]|uniref:L-fucose kinase n=1 Tax=Fimbriimonas ginsengisoli Gsoil 348 TaxID=661478 RepID=A0A068NLV1_FIMGI|nr:bifunctional fucokinase/fucose-1-phosphate guanylyltransferase [Fimbriimonas ginsengisoli]AIE83750.1 L-fucose kinase [Fimbriimonas ginsengisoli Gsoil 348]
MPSPQRLVTLPSTMAPVFNRLESRAEPDWFAAHDPYPLGSGGGTANALLAAWRASGNQRFYDWLRAERRIVIHAGGQSRRLPAYAVVGKALMPIPALRGSIGQKPDQALIDLQVGLCDQLFERSPDCLRVMVVSGDALLRPTTLPADIPDADVVCLGMRTDAETAQSFGAFFISHDQPDSLAMFLQKPAPDRTRALAVTHDCFLDTGIWLLSEDAVRALLERSGLENPDQGGTLKEYELYSDFGPALGRHPVADDPLVNALTSAVVPIQGEFLHFGTSRQLIESVTELHDQAHHASPLGFLSASRRHPNQHVQNAEFDGPPPFQAGHAYWVENSHVPPTWTLEGENVVTGIPRNRWGLTLPRGVCLDMVPVSEKGICARIYGFDDPFKGPIEDDSTRFLGRPLSQWLRERNLTLDQSPGTDIQATLLFPVLEGSDSDESLVAWMIDANAHPEMRERWIEARRLSASDLLSAANVDRIYSQRAEFASRSLKAMQRNHATSIFYSLDLERSAEILHRDQPDFEPLPLGEDASLVKQMHDGMFRSALLRLRGAAEWEQAEGEAFGTLRRAVLDNVPAMSSPTCGVASDQIVWGRSPLRFDLAGGWTDTPPYCLLNGGRVLNVAVELNGQPPVQVFVRRSERKDVLLRSIDLGTERRFSSFEELAGDLTERSEFSLAQAALSLAGFSPEPEGGTLERALERFGGGIEMSLLAAVPKGSGLGTSSILASTILASLSEFCNLGWSQSDVMARTLALEQILSTGGGWQDQVGGCLPGIKDLETGPGLVQNPTCRWLPDRLLGPENANHVALLYYTGITRVAKSVLREIVRGMFLNSGPRLDTLRKIRENVQPTADAIQRNHMDALGAAVRRSWQLNQELDSGTNPPPVQAILAKVEDYLLGAKLLGAGGGGFLFMIAKDQDAALRVRSILETAPPSDRARFFDFKVSQTGLEVTKS